MEEAVSLRDERQPPVATTTGVVKRDCPLCKTDNTEGPRSTYSYKEWTIRNCKTCGFVYIDHAPVYERLFEEIDWSKSFSREIDRKKQFRPKMYKLSRWTRWRMSIIPRRNVQTYLSAYNKTEGRLLDLGCGSGESFDKLPDFVPYGIEISKELSAQANAKFEKKGGCCINSSCVDGLRDFEDDFFDAASMRSYLEHEMAPLEVLQQLFRVLKPDGVAVIKVPNYGSVNRRVVGRNWCGFRYPDHLNYFTPATLARMTAMCGFTIRFGLIGRVPTSDNMWAVIRKRAGPR